MPSDVRRPILRIDDATVITLFKRLIELLPGRAITTHFSGGSNIQFEMKDYPEEDAVGKHFINYASITSVDGHEQFRLQFSRYLTDENNRHTPSAIYDQFSYNFGDDFGQWQKKFELVRNLISEIDLICIPRSGPRQGEEGHSSTVLQDLVLGFGNSHRTMLAELNRAVISAEERRKTLDGEFERKETSRAEKIAKALGDLEAQKAELERQSHMAERRRMLKELVSRASDLASQSALPRGSSLMRWSVFLTAVVLSLVAAVFSYESFVAIGSSTFDAKGIVLLARGFITGAISIGGLVYAIAWLRKFYESDLEHARALERFRFDLMRSSWVIETVLEVHHEGKGTVPQAWMDGVTKSLFDQSSATPRHDDASQALAALLGYTASASFGPDGPRFEIGKSGARKLSKEGSDKMAGE